jgi:hypothetical protein
MKLLEGRTGGNCVPFVFLPNLAPKIPKGEMGPCWWRKVLILFLPNQTWSKFRLIGSFVLGWSILMLNMGKVKIIGLFFLNILELDSFVPHRFKKMFSDEEIGNM